MDSDEIKQNLQLNVLNLCLDEVHLYEYSMKTKKVEWLTFTAMDVVRRIFCHSQGDHLSCNQKILVKKPGIPWNVYIYF